MIRTETARPSNRAAGALPWLACLLGLLIAFYPMVFSGFGRMMTDPGDTRFNGYVLEHGYRWLRGDALHRSFWDPPIFYPAGNTGAYSDVLLGVAPIYWLWRLAGYPPDTAFQFWMLTVSALNFLAAYLLLRRCLRVEVPAAALGAFVFAFGSSRFAQLGHQQLLAHFYVSGAVYAVFRIFEAHGEGKRRRARVWIVTLFLCIAAQLWAGYYLGWFLVIGLGATFLWALALPEYRRPLLSALRAYPLTILLALGLCAWLLAPMASHYLAAAATVRKRHYIDAYNTMPEWPLWFYQGKDSWLYGWAYGPGGWGGGGFEHEKRIGIGLATTLLAAFGLWKGRGRPAARLLALAALTLVFATQLLSHERELCKWYFYHFPGAYSVRVVSRVGLLMLVPGSVGVALGFERLRRQRGWLFCLLACALVILEQGRRAPSYDKSAMQAHVAELAAKVDPTCDAFLITLDDGPPRAFDLDAMWVELATHKPTINGYSGNQPVKWPPEPIGEEAQVPFEERLSAWLRNAGRGRERICWIRVPNAGPPRVVTYTAER